MEQPEEIQLVSLDNLHLDKENPRLPSFVNNQNEQQILDYIAGSTSIEELVSAIAENNYFSGEPLVVIPHPDPGKAGAFIVVEGNRRLTALRLLQDPRKWSTPSAKIIDIFKNAKYRPTTVPVVVKKTRDEVLPYLGYRHITGIKEWGSLAKARYMEQLFNRTASQNDVKEQYREVAGTIGSRRDHIKRNLEALAVYNIIEKNNFFGIDGLDEESIKFAVLSTALANPRIGKFIGLDEDSVNADRLNTDHIKEITEWLFKRDEKGKTKVGESRNIPQLAAVVDNPNSLEALRGGASLNIAYQKTADINEDFISALYRAEEAIRNVVALVASIEYSEQAFDIVKNIRANVSLVQRELSAKLLDEDVD